MSLRLKFVLALMLLSGTATIAVGAWSYISTRDELLGAIDRSLETARRTDYAAEAYRAIIKTRGPRPDIFDLILVQAIDHDGTVVNRLQDQELTVTDADLQVALDGAGYARHSITVDGESYRVLTFPSASGGAIQLARSLSETEDSLDAILRHTLWAVGIALVGSAIIGSLIGRQLTRRLQRLTNAPRESPKRLTPGGPATIDHSFQP